MGAAGNRWEQSVQFDVAGRSWVRLGVVGMGGRRMKRTTHWLSVNPVPVWLLVEEVNGGAMEWSWASGRGAVIALSIECECLGGSKDVMWVW